MEQLESELNLALKSCLPCGIRNQQHSLAIDLNLIPYYGNPSKDELPYIYRSQAKAVNQLARSPLPQHYLLTSRIC